MRKLFFVLFVCLIVLPAYAQQGAQQFEGFNLQGYTDTGSKAWDVKGDTAQVEGNLVNIHNVDANHYGEQPINLTATKGQLNKESGSVHLERDVVITSKNGGGQIKTDYLDWDKNNDIVKTDAPVVITDPSQGLTATGTGLQAHPNLQTAQMQQDVTVTVKNEKTQIQTITITCDGPMMIDQLKNKATFNKNVVAIESGRTLKADLMEVYFDPVTNKIKEAVCTGHVQMIQGGNVTNSEKAVYNGANQTLTLLGQPKLIMMTGDKGIMPALQDK
jgi:LPS export ABC transporter protein LptC